MTEKEKTSLNIYQRMLGVTNEVESFEKDGRNTHFNYKFAGIESIVLKLNPILERWGVALVTTTVGEPRQVGVRQKGKSGWNENQVTEVTICATAINVDNPDEQVSIECTGAGTDSQDKGIYKAISGARKYSIFLLFNLMSGDDDPEHSNSNNDDNDSDLL